MAKGDYTVSGDEILQQLQAGGGGVTRLRMNRAGVSALLKGPEVRRDLMRRGQAVQAALPTSNGEEWLVNTFDTDRANVTVRTGNNQAKAAAAKKMALIRALDAGR